MSHWEEAEHPRDDRGRFRDRWASHVSSAMAGITRGRDLLSDPDYDWGSLSDRANARWDSGVGLDHKDMDLAEIYHDQGYHGKPEVVSQERFDELARAGQILPLYRGVKTFERDEEPGKRNWTSLSIEQVSASLRDDDEHFAGYGVYGNGTYFSPEHHEAWKFAHGVREGWRGAMIRAALKPGARVITHEELRREHEQRSYESRSRRLQDEILASWPKDATPEQNQEHLAMLRQRQDALRDEYSEDFESLIGDMGRLAALLGYDAIAARRVDRLSEGEPYYNEIVVLNRTALIVDREPARDSMYHEDSAIGPARLGTATVLGVES